MNLVHTCVNNIVNSLKIKKTSRISNHLFSTESMSKMVILMCLDGNIMPGTSGEWAGMVNFTRHTCVMYN